MTSAAARERRLLITAGPTHEPIDDVRFLANRSSGRMGIAMARAAIARGWPATLLLGPTALPTPDDSQLRIIRFRTTLELQQALEEHWPSHDVLIMAAAVADYRPVGPHRPGKIGRGRDRITLELEPTPDLLASLAPLTRPGQVVIGFALAPADRLEASARRKLEEKGLHAIVANPLETMDHEAITATVHRRGGRPLSPPPNLSKPRFADWLLDHLDELSGPPSPDGCD